MLSDIGSDRSNGLVSVCVCVCAYACVCLYDERYLEIIMLLIL